MCDDRLRGDAEFCCSKLFEYQDRLNGYLDALKQRGVEIMQDLICTSEVSIQGGYSAVERLLNTGARFTAVVACGDTLAIGAIKALKDAGRNVPSDVAVTGFDDIELSSLYSPSLSTVRQPKKLIGIRSMEKMLDLIAGKKLANQQDVLTYELVIRESTGDFIG